MTSHTIWLLLLDIVLPFVLFFLSGRNGFVRRERSISNFWDALREKYPRSYFNQNKIIKKMRKFIGLETHGTIHWMTCFLHYIQIVMLVSPVFMFISFLFVQSEKIIVVFLVIGIAFPFGLFVVLLEIFTFFQVLRCKKIKKTNSKYSKREIYRWTRNHI